MISRNEIQRILNEMGDSTNLALVLLAAFWSGTSTVFTGIRETNAIRDRLITGTIDGTELTRKDCWHTFWWDWAPMKLSLSLISVVLGAVILELPNLRGGYGKDQSFAKICLIAAAMPVLGAMYQFVSFISDAMYLRRIILGHPKREHSHRAGLSRS